MSISILSAMEVLSIRRLQRSCTQLGADRRAGKHAAGATALHSALTLTLMLAAFLAGKRSSSAYPHTWLAIQSQFVRLVQRLDTCYIAHGP